MRNRLSLALHCSLGLIVQLWQNLAMFSSFTKDKKNNDSITFFKSTNVLLFSDTPIWSRYWGFFLLSFLTFATASYTQRELSFKFLSFIDFNSEWDSFRFSQTLPRLIAPLSCIRFCLSDYGRFWKKLELETLRGSSTFVTAFVYGRQFERIRLVIHRFVSGTFSSWILPPFFDIFFC